MTQAHHPGLLAQPQDLNEQILEGIEVAAPELTDAAVVRLLIPGQHPATWPQASVAEPLGQILVAGPLDLAG
ncbi:MAG: hypothetical protein ACKOPS_06895 [Cyanobium sp.]